MEEIIPEENKVIILVHGERTHGRSLDQGLSETGEAQVEDIAVRVKELFGKDKDRLIVYCASSKSAKATKRKVCKKLQIVDRVIHDKKLWSDGRHHPILNTEKIIESIRSITRQAGKVIIITHVQCANVIIENLGFKRKSLNYGEGVFINNGQCFAV